MQKIGERSEVRTAGRSGSALSDVTSLDAALTMNTAQFRKARGHLLDRVQPYSDWINARIEFGVFSYSKRTSTAPDTTCEATDLGGRVIGGINFASQDYLNLASHPAVKERAMAAVAEFGVHSAGSTALMGATHESSRLEQVIAEFLQLDHCILFPTGWAAGFGVITAFAGKKDHVVIDLLAHACLQEGANAATPNVHRTRHLSIDATREVLSRIRTVDHENGILVVSESLFSMDADTPNITDLVELCNEFDAQLVVDVAHDLGSMAPGGRGHLELQQVLGKPHLVMGSFSKTFASNGGFVASNHPAMRHWMQYNSGPLTFSNALSPVQTAVVLEAFRIVESPEGAHLRQRLLDNATYLRDKLSKAGFTCLGAPSPIVPVELGGVAEARKTVKELTAMNILVNLVEFPAVGRNRTRVRVQIMANHTSDQLDELVASLALARERTPRVDGADLELGSD